MSPVSRVGEVGWLSAGALFSALCFSGLMFLLGVVFRGRLLSGHFGIWQGPGLGLGRSLAGCWFLGKITYHLLYIRSVRFFLASQNVGALKVILPCKRACTKPPMGSW